MAQKGSSSCFGGSAGVVVCWAMTGHAQSVRPATAMIRDPIRRAIEAYLMTTLPRVLRGALLLSRAAC